MGATQSISSEIYEAAEINWRLIRIHHLDNLIWVWDANAPRNIKDDFAGAYAQSYYDELVELGEGRPIALGEVGHLATPQILTDQPRWAWFMAWNARLTTDAGTITVLSCDNLLTTAACCGVSSTISSARFLDVRPRRSPPSLNHP